MLSFLTMNRLYYHLFVLIQPTKIKNRATNPNHSNTIEISENSKVSIEGSEGVVKKRSKKENFSVTLFTGIQWRRNADRFVQIPTTCTKMCR